MEKTNESRRAIIIPALNEEEALKRLLREIPAHSADWVIVVDNGSSDGTARVAREAGATVISQQQRGYGRACYTGFQTARDLGADILIFMDGDGSDNPVDLTMMMAPILEGKADLAIGSRISAHAERGAVPPQARLGNWLVSRIISRLYGTHIEDIGSFRVIRTEKLANLGMKEMTFGWPVEMLVKSARAHYRIQEVDIRYRRRSAGHSKVAGNLVGSVKAAYLMLRTTFRYTGAREINV